MEGGGSSVEAFPASLRPIYRKADFGRALGWAGPTGSR